MAGVRLRNIIKRFGTVAVIHGVSLEVADGELVVFVGPSGCGKSTLLRMIAGLEDTTSGEIFIGNRMVNDVEPADRGIAMVFQSYALYPHMTVEQNLSFGLRMTGNDKADTARRVRRAGQTRHWLMLSTVAYAPSPMRKSPPSAKPVITAELNHREQINVLLSSN
jgi:lactose/L-arabinose transport system ATP-binding protein